MVWRWNGHQQPSRDTPAAPADPPVPTRFSRKVVPAALCGRLRREGSPSGGHVALPLEHIWVVGSDPGLSPVVGRAAKIEAEITARVRHVPSVVRSVLRKIGRRLEAHDPLAPADRKRVINRLFPGPAGRRQFFARFMALMALSVTLATLGIIADSTAVVIGAMLVAPLMGPVLGVAAAMTMAWPRRLVRQGLLVAAGAGLGIGLAALISFLVPVGDDPLPGELLSRTSPNLLDLGIAVAAGVAGAYAQVRRQASEALPGVAVAVALVPPLAVIGITLQMGAWQMAHGAFLLFVVNVVGTTISAALTFIAAGLVPGWRLMSGESSIAAGLRLMTLAVIMVVLPLQFGRGRVLPASDRTAEVVAAVHEFVEAAPADVVDISIGMVGGVTDVGVVVATSSPKPPRAGALADFLAARIDTPVTLELKVVEATTTSVVGTTPK